MQQHDLKSDAAVVAIQPDVSKLTTFAQTLAIKSADGYHAAASHLTAIKGVLKKISDAHARVKKPLLDATRELDKQKNEASAPLEQAELLIKRAMNAYSEEQRRIQQEEQRKADEAVRKEQHKLQERAAKAEASGKIEKAAALQVQAQTIVAPVISREPPKVAGIVTRQAWKFEVVDASLVPREYLSIDEKKIGGVVRSLKGDTKIPGVRVWPEDQIAAAAGAA